MDIWSMERHTGCSSPLTQTFILGLAGGTGNPQVPIQASKALRGIEGRQAEGNEGIS